MCFDADDDDGGDNEHDCNWSVVGVVDGIDDLDGIRDDAGDYADDVDGRQCDVYVSKLVQRVDV